MHGRLEAPDTLVYRPYSMILHVPVFMPLADLCRNAFVAVKAQGATTWSRKTGTNPHSCVVQSACTQPAMCRADGGPHLGYRPGRQLCSLGFPSRAFSGRLGFETQEEEGSAVGSSCVVHGAPCPPRRSPPQSAAIEQRPTGLLLRRSCWPGGRIRLGVPASGQRAGRRRAQASHPCACQVHLATTHAICMCSLIQRATSLVGLGGH